MITGAAKATPLLILGAGHMGGALITGWRRSGALAGSDLFIRDPTPGVAARAATTEGARLNPSRDDITAARTVVLALKPQVWEPIAREIAPFVAPDATIVSIMAGVGAAALADVFPGRAIVRAMPNTAAAIGEGATGVWSATPDATVRALALFAPLGEVIELASEDQIHAVTAASGSAPAYVYALVEALESAGRRAGLSDDAARTLSRSALTGAAALLEAGGEEAGELRRQVTSPGGTTEAALKVLIGAGALEDLVTRAVLAAQARSRQLGGES